MSNYVDAGEAETPFVLYAEQEKTVPCKPCYGTGTVEIDGWETDCVDCQGWGDVPLIL